MKKHSLKEWIEVTRYWSFAVSAMPVIVTFAYLCSEGLLPEGPAPIVNFFLALAGAVILHAAGNVLSDWFDYRSGVDNENAFAVPNLVFHKFEPSEYLKLSIALFIAGSAIGVFLVFRTGLPLLLIGGAGVLLTAGYSFLKYHALGDLDIFLIFAPLIIMGTTWVVCGALLPQPLVLALPLGIITVSVLHANNTVDIVSDGAAGIRTFAMILGGKASCRLYRAYMLLPFICIIASVAAGWLHFAALSCLIALPAAIKNFKVASHFDEKGIETMSGLDRASAKLQTTFSTLLAASLFIASLF